MTALKLNVFLGVAVLLAMLTLPLGAFGQQTDDKFFNLGVAKLHKGDLDGAIVDFTKAIELGTNDASFYTTRCVVRLDKGDRDGSIADFKKAIEFNQKYAEAYIDRGIAKKAKGDLDGAIDDYSKAFEGAPVSKGMKDDLDSGAYPKLCVWVTSER